MLLAHRARSVLDYTDRHTDSLGDLIRRLHQRKPTSVETVALASKFAHVTRAVLYYRITFRAHVISG